MNKSIEFNKAINEVANKIRANTTWRHYKGGIYHVKNFAIDTDNGKVRVIYSRIDGPDFNLVDSQIDYARPAEEWFTDTEIAPGEFVPRFEKVTKASTWVVNDQDI